MPQSSAVAFWAMPFFKQATTCLRRSLSSGIESFLESFGRMKSMIQGSRQSVNYLLPDQYHVPDPAVRGAALRVRHAAARWDLRDGEGVVVRGHLLPELHHLPAHLPVHHHVDHLDLPGDRLVEEIRQGP